jgi:hypothetical protein
MEFPSNDIVCLVYCAAIDETIDWESPVLDGIAPLALAVYADMALGVGKRAGLRRSPRARTAAAVAARRAKRRAKECIRVEVMKDEEKRSEGA